MHPDLSNIVEIIFLPFYFPILVEIILSMSLLVFCPFLFFLYLVVGEGGRGRVFHLSILFIYFGMVSIINCKH